MALTPELKAQWMAEYQRLKAAEEPGPEATPKPAEPPMKVVAEAGRVIAPAVVRVSPDDPNWPSAGSGGFVRIDMAEAERQRLWREHDAMVERRRRKEIDPFNYGHWGPTYED